MSDARIYRTEPYAQSNISKIIGITEKDGFDVVACGSSVFFPEGGGQPSDIGTISRGAEIYNVTSAYDENLESDVWHVTDAPAGTFCEGDEVELTINWDHRFCNMQRHCGEHMLSGTMHALFGGINRGFHMGEEYITIDIDLDGRMLTDEELDLAEKTVNEAIWADLPVTITYFDNYEASLVMPVRKQVPHDGQVSIVTVGELPDPYDCIACCGTHPSSSAQIGLLAIYKHEPNKGMNRIYFDCGIKAKEKLSADFGLLTELARRSSCSTGDLLHKMETTAEEISELKVQLATVSSYIKDAEKPVIIEGLKRSDRVFQYSFDLLSVDDLLKLGFSAISEVEGKLLVLMHPKTCTALLFSSGEAKCGSIVKANAPACNGRGGGRDDNARAVFQSVKDMKKFAEAIV